MSYGTETKNIEEGRCIHCGCELEEDEMDSGVCESCYGELNY